MSKHPRCHSRYIYTCIWGGPGAFIGVYWAPALPLRSPQHPPPRHPVPFLHHPSAAPSTHPHGAPLTPSTAPSTAPSTNPHGAPYHPTNRPLRGSQHPPPRRPVPPHQPPPPQPPAPAPTAPHATSSTAPSAAPSPHFPRHPTPHPPTRLAQPPRLVSRFPHRKNSGGQIKKNGTRVQWLRSPWEDGPPPRRPRGSHRNEMAHCNVTDSP